MLDDISYKTLLQLYQPIMGMEAVSLYMTLYSELDQITLTKSPSLISRLCKMTGFSLNELSQSLSKLEAIGLMSSYKKKSQENRFLFDLKIPYLPHEFLNHPILNDLLQQRLKDEYKKQFLYLRSIMSILSITKISVRILRMFLMFIIKEKKF